MNSHNFPSTEYMLKLGKPKTYLDNNYQLLDKDKCDTYLLLAEFSVRTVN